MLNEPLTIITLIEGNKRNFDTAAEKREQIEALDLLNNYISDLTVSGKLSKNNVEDAKHEQSKILNELKNIQKGLDGIINDTNDININLKQKNLI